jgi:hypothetical protein
MWKPGATSGITVAGGNGQGNGLNQFSRPRNSNMDIYGNIYVADEGDGVNNHGRVLKFNPVINDTLVTQRDGEYFAVLYPFLSGQSGGLSAFATQPVDITPATLATQVTISANPGNEVCNGMGVQFVASPVNGGSNPVFQWFFNGTLQAVSGSSFIDANANQGDQISCVMTSNAACAAPLIDTSNTIILLSATTSVSISLQGGTNVCSGTPAVFTATPGNAGANYFYQWIKNGNNVGPTTQNNIYADAGLNTGDKISCLIYNTLPCAAPSQAQSNIIQITSVYTANITAPYGYCVNDPLFDSINFIPSSLVWMQNGSAVQSISAQWNPNGITIAGGNVGGDLC